MAHHPAEKQIQPLARAAGGGARKEIADARPLRDAAVRGLHVERERALREAVDRRTEIGRGRIVAIDEEALDRSAAVDHLPHDPQQRGDVGAARPAVHDLLEGGAVPPRIEPAHVVGRVRSGNREDALDRLQHAGDASERERRGDEADDFAIRRRRETADDLNRVRGGIGIIEFAVEPIQNRLHHANLKSEL